LRDAVTAAGARVSVEIEGGQAPLSAEADHAAYRILQESLTNVLRHAGPAAAAQIWLRYQPGVLVITVTDDGGAAAETSAAVSGNGPGHRGPEGHGIGGMRERAALVGGELAAGPLPAGGFQVQATLPTLAPSAAGASTAGASAAGASTATPSTAGESS
jgi:signal transduction histidine kinase